MLRRVLLITLIMIITSAVSCSRAGDPFVAPTEQHPKLPGVDHDKSASLDEEYSDFPIAPFLVRNLYRGPIEQFYWVYGRVPTNFAELVESGLVMGIPKCPYTDTFYTESYEVSADTPSNFSYHSNSDKSYGVSWVDDRDGDMKIFNHNVDEVFWEQALILEPGKKNPTDAKIAAMLESFAFAFKLFYHENKRLPDNPAELLADFKLVEEAWRNPSGVDDIYFEFGVDCTNSKIYGKYKYTTKFGNIFAQRIESMSFTPRLEGDYSVWLEHINILPFDRTPDPNMLILNPWFTLDNLECVYSELTDR